MEYKIVARIKPQYLEETVNNLLREGWKLRGELIVRDSGYYQVMVRPDKEEYFEEAFVSKELANEIPMD